MQKPHEAQDPLIGARIDGRYVVHALLGRGGMGVVYEGVHEQLGRPVAIKVMAAAISHDPIAVERFLREARTASTLTHGNIVDVSDLGQLPDGRPYFVMPKMQGEDLLSLLQRLGPQSPARVVVLLRGAAAALDLIHAKGMVHRDVKPENLMHVVREDGSEAVLLLDFGIVGLIASNAVRLTVEGSIFGTPAYLPPEVVETSKPDRRGDVYALATVAFELMTGKLPFDAENPLQILPKKLMAPAPRMSQVSETAFAAPIEAVIARGLEREPSARYASAGAFVQALEAAVRRAEAGELHPHADADELDTDGAGALSPLRARLRSAETADLELSLDAADAPARLQPTAAALPAGAASAQRAAVPPAPRALPERARRRALLGVGAGAVVALALGLALLLHDRSAPGRHDAVSGVASPPAGPAAAAAPVGPASPGAELARSAAPPMPAAPAPSVPSTDLPSAAGAPAAQASPVKLAAASSAATESKPESSGVPRVHRASPPRAPAPGASGAGAAASAAAASSGPSAAELDQQATRNLLQGHPGQAAELYLRATQLDPRDAAAWRGLGITSEGLGRKDEALRAFRRALALSPSGPNAESIRARLHKLEPSP